MHNATPLDSQALSHEGAQPPRELMAPPLCMPRAALNPRWGMSHSLNSCGLGTCLLRIAIIRCAHYALACLHPMLRAWVPQSTHPFSRWMLSIYEIARREHHWVQKIILYLITEIPPCHMLSQPCHTLGHQCPNGPKI